MGVGNRYTLEEDNKILAYFVDCSCGCYENDDFDCNCCNYELEYLKEVIEKLPLFQRYGWDDSRNSCYYGEMYKISLKYGNHDEIVIDLEFQNDCQQYGLQVHNYEKTYLKIIKHINKHLPLAQGFGYTSAYYQIGDIK